MASGALRHRAYRRRRRNGKGTPRWLMALGMLGGLMAIGAGILAGVAYGVYQSYANDLIPPDEAIAKLPRGGARIYDRNGQLLYEYVDDVSGLREPVKSQDFSLFLIGATIATEDTSFLNNPGVNFKGLAAAAWDNFSPGGTPGLLEGRGGSSITQQLVKNVYFSPEERGKRSVDRKLKETVYALELKKQYSNEQIMEWYLNSISYGSVYVGAEAAAQGYFSKSAKALSLSEAATLAAIPSCPRCYDPINKPEAAVRQRNLVLRRMLEEGYITAEVTWLAASEPLVVRPQPFPVKAPHFVFNVVERELISLVGEEAFKRGGLNVTTTLDLDLQRTAEGILEEEISAVEAGALGHNGALVAIDPSTAQILTYVGSRSYFREDILGRNDMAAAENSPGSAFKPLTYLAAFENLGWSPGTLILDSAITIQDGAEGFSPRGPGGFRGPTTIRKSLGNSLNATAVKTMLYTGVRETIGQAKSMGMTTLDRPGLGPALTTGGGDVKLADLTYAYTVFPNLGLLKGRSTNLKLPPGNRANDPISVLRIEDRDGKVIYPLVDGQPKLDGPAVQEQRVASEEAAYFVNDILADPQAECETFGCGGLSLGDDRPFAAKTGTSAPYRNSSATGDTWTVAYTPQLVAGTWYGNADNSPLAVRAFSTTVSFPIIRRFMREFHSDKPIEQFQRPDTVIQGSVCVLSGFHATPDCPLTTPDDLVALPEPLPEGQPAPTATVPPTAAPPGQDAPKRPEDDDPWWERVAIDRRSNKLASALTLPQDLEYRFFLQLPAGLPEFHVQQAREWASRLGATIGQAPKERTTDADIPIAITQPANGQQVTAQVIITGRARSADFRSYYLEYEWALSPGRWVPIGGRDTPVADGPLAIWDTRGLFPGGYTIRLVIVDGSRGEIATQVQVSVVPSLPPAPTPPGPLPVITPTPTPGSQGDGPGRGRRNDD